MSKVDWSLAPEGATHYCDGAMSGFWRDLSERTWKFYRDSDRTWHDSGDKVSSLLHNGCGLKLIQRPQPKPWSGPEDGLPPVGSKCRVVKIDGIDAHLDTECKIVAHEMNGENMVAVYMHGKAYAMYVGIGISDCFSLTKAPDARETAIRDVMDIAQVDCRVTAARLVDAGFKREVV